MLKLTLTRNNTSILQLLSILVDVPNLGCTIMTKIIIVDYSLEIVIAIINNDYFEQIYAIVWSCMPYFYIKYIF